MELPENLLGASVARQPNEVDAAAYYQRKIDVYGGALDTSKNFDEVRVLPKAHIGWGDLPVGSADPREHSVKPAYFDTMLPQIQEGGTLSPSILRAQGLDEPSIKRLHRTLQTYSFGFSEAVMNSCLHATNRDKLIPQVWQVYMDMWQAATRTVFSNETYHMMQDNKHNKMLLNQLKDQMDMKEVDMKVSLQSVRNMELSAGNALEMESSYLRQIAELKRRSAGAEDKLVETSHKMEQLQADLKKLEAELDESRDYANIELRDRLMAEGASGKARRAEDVALAKLELLEEAVARLEAANAELERVLPEKEKKLLGATTRLAVAEEELSVSKEELASALDKLEFHTLDHRRAKTLLLVDLQYNRSQLAEARSRVAFLEHALQMYRTEDSRLLRTQMSMMKEDLAGYVRAAATSDAEMAKSQAALAAAHAKVRQREQQAFTSRTLNDGMCVEMEGRLAEAHKQFEQESTTRNDLEIRLKRKREKKKQHKAQAERFKAEVAATKTAVASQHKINEQIKKNLGIEQGHMEKNIEKMRRESMEVAREAELECKKARDETVTRTRALAESKKREQDVSYKMSVFEAENKVLTGKLQDEFHAHRELVTSYSTQVHELKAKCESKESAHAQTHKEWTASKELIARLEIGNEEYTQENLELKQEVEGLRAKSRKQQTTLTDLEMQNKHMTLDIEALGAGKDAGREVMDTLRAEIKEMQENAQEETGRFREMEEANTVLEEELEMVRLKLRQANQGNSKDAKLMRSWLEAVRVAGSDRARTAEACIEGLVREMERAATHVAAPPGGSPHGGGGDGQSSEPGSKGDSGQGGGSYDRFLCAMRGMRGAAEALQTQGAAGSPEAAEAQVAALCLTQLADALESTVPPEAEAAPPGEESVAGAAVAVGLRARAGTLLERAEVASEAAEEKAKVQARAEASDSETAEVSQVEMAEVDAETADTEAETAGEEPETAPAETEEQAERETEMAEVDEVVWIPDEETLNADLEGLAAAWEHMTAATAALEAKSREAALEHQGAYTALGVAARKIVQLQRQLDEAADPAASPLPSPSQGAISPPAMHADLETELKRLQVMEQERNSIECKEIDCQTDHSGKLEADPIATEENQCQTDPLPNEESLARSIQDSPSQPQTIQDSPSQPQTIPDTPSLPQTIPDSPSQPQTILDTPSQPQTTSDSPSQPQTIPDSPSQPQTIPDSPSQPQTIPDKINKMPEAEPTVQTATVECQTDKEPELKKLAPEPSVEAPPSSLTGEVTDLQWNLGRFQELYDKVEGLVQAAAGGFIDPAAAVEEVRGFLAENDDIAGELFPNNVTEAGTQELSRSALEKLQGYAEGSVAHPTQEMAVDPEKSAEEAKAEVAGLARPTSPAQSSQEEDSCDSVNEADSLAEAQHSVELSKEESKELSKKGSKKGSKKAYKEISEELSKELPKELSKDLSKELSKRSAACSAGEMVCSSCGQALDHESILEEEAENSSGDEGRTSDPPVWSKKSAKTPLLQLPEGGPLLESPTSSQAPSPRDTTYCDRGTSPQVWDEEDSRQASVIHPRAAQATCQLCPQLRAEVDAVMGDFQRLKRVHQKLLLGAGMLEGAQGDPIPRTPLGAPFVDRGELQRRSPPRSKFSRKLAAMRTTYRPSDIAAWEGTENKSVKFRLEQDTFLPAGRGPEESSDGEKRLPDLSDSQAKGGHRGPRSTVVDLRLPAPLEQQTFATRHVLRRPQFQGKPRHTSRSYMGKRANQMQPMWLPVQSSGGLSSGSDGEIDGPTGYISTRPSTVSPSVGAAFMRHPHSHVAMVDPRIHKNRSTFGPLFTRPSTTEHHAYGMGL